MYTETKKIWFIVHNWLPNSFNFTPKTLIILSLVTLSLIQTNAPVLSLTSLSMYRFERNRDQYESHASTEHKTLDNLNER